MCFHAKSLFYMFPSVCPTKQCAFMLMCFHARSLFSIFQPSAQCASMPSHYLNLPPLCPTEQRASMQSHYLNLPPLCPTKQCAFMLTCFHARSLFSIIPPSAQCASMLGDYFKSSPPHALQATCLHAKSLFLNLPPPLPYKTMCFHAKSLF